MEIYFDFQDILTTLRIYLSQFHIQFLKLKKINELISLINASGFKLDLVKDHGYGDIYILNEILPYILQKNL